MMQSLEDKYSWCSLSLLRLHTVFTCSASLMWLRYTVHANHIPAHRSQCPQPNVKQVSVQLSKPGHSCDLDGRETGSEGKGCKRVQYFPLYSCPPLPDMQLAEKKHQGKVNSCLEHFQVRYILGVASNVMGGSWRGHASIYHLTVTSSDILTRCYSENTFSVPNTI